MVVSLASSYCDAASLWGIQEVGAPTALETPLPFLIYRTLASTSSIARWL
jgi:hypothetical protein